MATSVKKRASMIFALLLMAGGIATSSNAAITVEGDYCWNVKITEDRTGTVSIPAMVVKLHIVPLGNGSVASWAGKINVASGPFYMTGIASVTPTTIVANLATSQIHADGWRDTGTMRFTINQSTLTGTFYELGHDFNKTSHAFDQSRYTAGNLTPRSCP